MAKTQAVLCIWETREPTQHLFIYHELCSVLSRFYLTAGNVNLAFYRKETRTEKPVELLKFSQWSGV